MRNNWVLVVLLWVWVLVLVVSAGPLVRAGCTNDDIDNNGTVDGRGVDEFDLCLLEDDADIFESELEQDCSTGKGLRFCLECDCESTVTCAVPFAVTVPCAVIDLGSL